MEALHHLMRLDEPPTAIVGATDVLAIGLVHAALQRGLRVPADVSVTGFDDIPGAHVIMPPLTTMRMPVRAMVKAAIDIAIGLVHAALQRGLRVPADVSVTGFDDIPGAHVIMPPLTTMRMPVRAMVKAAIDIAIGSPSRQFDPAVDVHPVFEAELVVRDSTGPPQGARNGA
jgi:LacI family transcriptional regulator